MTQTELQQFDWSSHEAGELRDFLKTGTGIKLLRALANSEPELLGKGDTNEILIKSGEVRQHKYLTSFLLSLTGDGFEHHEESELSNSYPSLDDDSKWDGPKLNEPQ